MIKSSFLAIIIASPGWAAEIIPIKSGEHDGFTRLVLQVDPSIEWGLKQDAHRAELMVTGADFTFDEARIFDRIAKNRLLSTSAEEGQTNSKFFMDLACACRVNAYGYLDAYIVVDIFDPDGTEENLAEIVQTTDTERRAPQLWDSQSNQFARVTAPVINALPPQAPTFYGSITEKAFPEQASLTAILNLEAPPETAGVITESRPADANTPVDGKTEEPSQMDDDLAETVAMARMQLLQQLTMAAEQGLLDFDGPIPDSEADEEPEEVHEVVEETPEPTAPSHPLDDRQLRVQSVYDRDAGTAEVLELLSEHNTCPTDESLDIASWGSGVDFNDEIAASRITMLREFDKPDISVVSAVIHTYIRYGFGVEAATYLNDYDTVPDHDLLMDLAAIVDGNSVIKNGPLSQASLCSGTAGLWSIVGVYPAIEAPLGDIASIIDAFAEMPIDLRRMIGPRLTMAFLARGLEDEASIVSDIVERAPGENDETHTLSRADIALDQGYTDEAADLYENLAEENSDVSVDALIRLAEVTLNEGRRMTNEVLVDLGAAADEARGTAKGTELRRFEALWIAELSGGNDALALISAEIERDQTTAKLLEQAAREVLWGMSSNDVQDDYVETIDQYANFITSGPDGYRLRSKIGRELLDAGLPNVALEILQIEQDADNSDGILLAAKANLQMYRSDVALTLLAGATGDQAKLLRIEANLNKADFDDALIDLKAIENQELASVDPAWFSGNWKQIATENPIAAEILYTYTDHAADTMFAESLSLNESSSLLEIQDILESSNAASSELAAILNDQ